MKHPMTRAKFDARTEGKRKKEELRAVMRPLVAEFVREGFVAVLRDPECRKCFDPIWDCGHESVDECARHLAIFMCEHEANKGGE